MCTVMLYTELHCTVLAQYAVCSIQYAVYSVKCAVYSVQCAVCSVECAVCSMHPFSRVWELGIVAPPSSC